MNLLALETSTMMGSVALVKDGLLIAEYQLRVDRTYSEVILPSIDHLLESSKTSIGDIDCFAVARGPGSFTALRIGISVVQGLSLGTDKPVIPVPSLDGLAQNIYFCSGLICPLFDARKGEVYTATYRRSARSSLEQLTPYRAIQPEILLNEIHDETFFLGDGSVLYRDLISGILQEKAHFAPPHLNYPRASAVAQLALKKMNSTAIPARDNTLITPFYLRFPEAEVAPKK